MLRALGSVSCDIIHETEGTVCYGHWVLHLVISPTNQQGYDLLRSFCSATCEISHETGGTICYGRWVLHLAVSYTVRYGQWVLHLLISHTKQGKRFVMCIGLCSLSSHSQDRGYDLLRALGCVFYDITHETGGTTCYVHWASASCDITHETDGTICYGRWVLHLVISHTRHEVRIVSGIGFCVLRYHTRDRGYHSLRA